ncbi:MAG TPA: SDR family oxidoreductase [Acidimicrobiia bacterium]|nr:SDR family oxidoreductase [Acidimicrobiia bacterium]
MIDPATALRLDGKVVLVTGGTRGIGRAIVEASAAAGGDVAVVARKPAELEETAAAVTALGARVATFTGSVGDPDVADAAVAATIDQLGRCDVVVNNAAINPVFGPLMEADLGAVAKVLDANIVGPLRFARSAWHRYMREHGGVILNVVSVGGMRPGPFIGAYNVSKAALIHLTRQLAQELAPSVRVNAIAPALVKTDMARALWEPNEEAMARSHALGRLGVPDDIASGALFLISEASSWLTGEVLVVDGGAGVSLR